MGGRQYIPLSDAGFDAWQENFIAKVAPNLTAWGIPTAEFNRLLPLRDAWRSAWAKAKNRETRTMADVKAKNTAKKAYIAGIRKFVNEWIRGNSKITPAQLIEIGVGVRKPRRRVPIPPDAPILYIDFSERLLHIVHWGPNPLDERRNPKPKGVIGCELRMFIGPMPPPNPDAMKFVCISTNSPERIDMSAYPRQTIYWIGRYINTRGEPGPWSDIISAEVTA